MMNHKHLPTEIHSDLPESPANVNGKSSKIVNRVPCQIFMAANCAHPTCTFVAHFLLLEGHRNAATMILADNIPSSATGS